MMKKMAECFEEKMTNQAKIRLKKMAKCFF